MKPMDFVLAVFHLEQQSRNQNPKHEFRNPSSLCFDATRPKQIQITEKQNSKQ
jgi:hypothetical protein